MVLCYARTVVHVQCQCHCCKYWIYIRCTEYEQKKQFIAHFDIQLLCTTSLTKGLQFFSGYNFIRNLCTQQ